MEELKEQLIANGYEGNTDDIFAIYDWLSTQTYTAFVSGMRGDIFGSKNEWTYDIHLYHDKEFAGFKNWTGTYKEAVKDAIRWALNEIEKHREDPDHRAKALAEAVFLPPYM